jgi:hypothetical protein
MTSDEVWLCCGRVDIKGHVLGASFLIIKTEGYLPSCVYIRGWNEPWQTGSDL